MSSIEYKWTDGTNETFHKFYSITEEGFQRTILQTREIMADAVVLYVKLGYHSIDNYPPYNELNGAICFAKELI